MKTAEMKIVVSGGRVIEAKVMPDGCCVLAVELATGITEDATCHLREGIFKKVPASELSLNDKFMNHIPKTKQEKNLMEEVKKVITVGMYDFWRPVCDPSLDNKGRICYEPGKMPAVDKSYNWWAKKAKEFFPERGSRLGTKSEYVAFLATLIKELVATGWKVADAWYAVCNDSKKLGHYRNSKDAKNGFESTGSREVCDWCDLGNVYKIVAEDKETGVFWVAGGCYYDGSDIGPLAVLYPSILRNIGNTSGCGWIVLTEGSTDH